MVGSISVGFPLGLLSRVFLDSRSHWDTLMACSIPKLLIVGGQDQFTSLSTYTSLVQEYRKHRQDNKQTGSLEVRVLEMCDHFFCGEQHEVAAKALQWIDSKEQTSSTQ